jgi:hypothetical protein
VKLHGFSKKLEGRTAGNLCWGSPAVGFYVHTGKGRRQRAAPWNFASAIERSLLDDDFSR